MSDLSWNEAGIPAELRQIAHWLVWRYEQRGEKWTKVPYQATVRGQVPASTTDDQSWADYRAAAAAAPRFDGIGFVFSPEDQYAGIDLDNCRDPETGAIAAWAQEILDTLDSYAEVTPSGRGIHIICKGSLPPGRRREGPIEMYETGRYFTMTGQRLVGYPDPMDRSSILESLHAKLFPTEPEPSHAITRAYNGAAPEDEAVERMVRRLPAYDALWRGDHSAYDSHSEADLALCGRIAFFAGPDPAAVDRVFRQSGLYRDKWDDPHHGRQGSTYGQGTVTTALSGKMQFFEWGRTKPLNSLESLSSYAAPAIIAEPTVGNTPFSSDWPADLAPEAFYGIAGEVVQALAPETEADPAALLVNLLVTFGNAAGRRPHVSVLTSRHSANLFAALVGATGEGSKGSSWDPMEHFFQQALPDYMRERVFGGISSGEGLISLVRDRIEKRQQIKDKKTGRMTMEFETVVEDEGVEDKRCLLVESEMSSLLKIMNRPGNVLSEQLRKAWDKGDLQNLNKNTSIRATGAHISVLGHITPDALRQHLTHADAANGFANRFLWMLVRRSQYLPEGGNLTHVLTYLLTYITYTKELVELASDKIMISRQADARRMWAAVYEDLRRPGVGMFGELTARRAPIVARLSLIYCLLDGFSTILPEHLLAALAIWERSEASVRFLFGDATGDPTADALYEAMLNRPEGANRSDLHAALGRNRPVADLDRALTALQRADRAKMLRQKGDGGREVEAWYALPIPKVVGSGSNYLAKARAAYDDNESNENKARVNG